MLSLGYKCQPLFDFIPTSATFTTGNNTNPVTLKDDTDFGLDPPLRLFDVINHKKQSILYVQLPVLRPGVEGPSEATTALREASHTISEMRFAMIADKDQRCIKSKDR